jgi:hypothetical protein
MIACYLRLQVAGCNS